MMKIKAVRTFALSLPETSEEPHFHYSSFRVKGKIFATVPPGDEFVNVMLSEHDARAAAAEDPKACAALPWGKKIAGVQVTLAHAEPAHVRELLEDAWRAKAPKTVVAAFDKKK
jgi:hypothetical protein